MKSTSDDLLGNDRISLSTSSTVTSDQPSIGTGHAGEVAVDERLCQLFSAAYQ